MYERFTDRGRKVMQLANQEAQRLNHEYIGTEHILLGLAKEGSGVAAHVLKNLDVDLRKVRQEVEKIALCGPEDVTLMNKLPPTPKAKKVIEYAVEEARNLGHNYVGTEHLLLGLIREEEGVAAQVLMNLGLKLEDVREEVLNLLGHNLETAGGLHDVGGKSRPPKEKSKERPDVPAPIGEALRELEAQLEQLAQLKLSAVSEQDFEKAARLRDQEDALKKQREDTLRAWEGKKVLRAREYELYLPRTAAAALDRARQALRDRFGGFLESTQLVTGTWPLGDATLSGELAVLRVYSADAAQALLFLTQLKEELRGLGGQEPLLIMSRRVEVL